MSNDASFSISVKDGRIEVSGSEEFVREQIKEFRDVIKITATKVEENVSSTHQSEAGPTAESLNVSDQVDSNPYPNVLALEKDGIRILKTIPGKNKPDKTRNIALLLLLGKKLMGESSVPTKEIRTACERHACLDKGNFAKHIKSGKQDFIINGSGKGSVQRAKLTHPGEQKAKEIAEELNSK